MSKVLFHICDGVYPQVVGGMEIFNYYLVKHLAGEVAVFSSMQYDFGGVEHIRYRRIRPTKIFDAVQLFFVLLRHRDIQTVVFSYSEAHWLLWYTCMLAVKLAGRRYICVVHHGKNPSGKHGRQIGRFLRNSQEVVAVSEDIRRNYDTLYGISCTVVPPLIPFGQSMKSRQECRENYGIPADAFVICQVGTIKGMKNPQTAIEALSLFTKEELSQYNPHIVFAGRNLMQDPLQRLVREKGLEDRVHFIGFVPVESVRDVMRLSDAYLIASDYEGTSVSLLEAMYNSMPILATDVRGINDMVSDMDNALLFPLKDAAALKADMMELIRDGHLCKSLGEAARARYDSEYDYAFVLEAYRKILYLK